MIIILAILVILFAILLGVSVVSNSVTQITMSDALLRQAEATKALAMTELLRQVIVLVALLLVGAVVVLAIVVVLKRKAAKQVTIRPTPFPLPEGKGLLTQVDPMTQVTQLFMIQLMRDMARDQKPPVWRDE